MIRNLRIRTIYITLIFLFNLQETYTQNVHINEVKVFDNLKLSSEDYIYTGFLSWYKSICLYDKGSLCKQGTRGGARVLIYTKNDISIEKLLISNKSGYKRPSFDSLIYRIPYKNLNNSKLTRKLYSEEFYEDDRPFVIDSIELKIIDTLLFDKKKLIRRVFKKQYKDGLKIYVFSSSSISENDALHFWVQGIGIIKVVYRDCWMYSFELNFEDRIKNSKNKLFIEIIRFIKKSYKDPEWLDAPCNFEL